MLFNRLKHSLFIVLLIGSFLHSGAQTYPVKVSTIGPGWANNSVNTVIFRKNSLVTFKGEQYAAYYDQQQVLTLAKRKSGSNKWQVAATAYKGDAADAHKTISIMIDGAGYLHVAWGLHNEPLNYAVGIAPGSLALSAKKSMTGIAESRVSYPEFYKLPKGDLLFLYRNGASGNGNLVINRYLAATKKWVNVQSNLIDGEGKRNAYWQMAIDKKGFIHLSWVWRESPDVASNHDMCYALSKDGGINWERSTGQRYNLPITAATAEHACEIPQKSELINQTSMVIDDEGSPFIASYWREEGQTVPQYHIIYKNNGRWANSNLNFRKTPFSLSGMGTKSIPISRPQVIAWKQGKNMAAALIFRDIERGNKISVALTGNLTANKWTVNDLSAFTVGAWEPTYDTELWKDKKILNLFIQKVVQVDGEGQANITAQPVQVLEVDCASILSSTLKKK
jgi:hypothetical protein